MNAVIITSRLVLRTFTINDARLLYDLNADEEVIRFTHDPIIDIGHAKQVLEQTIIPQYALYNHGRWAVHVKSDLEFIGWCGLKFIAGLKETDLGYRFKRSFWRKGYGYEAASACLKYGFENLGLPLVTARVETGNIGSIRVLEKCGMRFKKEELVDHYLVRVYELYNPFISR